MSDNRTFKEVFKEVFEKAIPPDRITEHCCHNTVLIEYKARGKTFYCYIPQELWDMPYKDLEGVKQ